MHFLKSVTLAALLIANTAFGDGFGFSLGPFSLLFGSFDGNYLVAHRHVLDNPICFAISHQKKLDIIVEGSETVSTKEKKIITKEITVEPYAFGVNQEGKPFLKGKVVNEKMIKEVSVKFGEDQFDESSINLNEKDKGSFFGRFTTEKSQTIDIRRIVQLRVIEDSHFDIPKDFKGVSEPNMEVICQLPKVAD